MTAREPLYSLGSCQPLEVTPPPTFVGTALLEKERHLDRQCTAHGRSSSMAARLSAPMDYAALLRDYDTWLFDCDGVLWRGDHLLDGVIEVLHLLRKLSE